MRTVTERCIGIYLKTYSGKVHSLVVADIERVVNNEAVWLQPLTRDEIAAVHNHHPTTGYRV